MLEEALTHDGGRGAIRVPARVAVALAVIVGLVIAGGIYLVWVRGDALFLDLAGLSGLLFCF